MSSQHQPLPWSGLAHLGVVYVAWGSTYLAMRETALGGFPPLIMGAGRTCIAAALLMIIAKFMGLRIALTKREALLLAASGLLLWLGGNGFVATAEKRIASGYAALIVGSTPIWPPIFEFILDRRKPTGRLLLSLFVGFVGLAVLVSPMLERDARADLPSALMLVFATFSWALGTLLLQRRPINLPPISTSAWQHAFGGIALGIASYAIGEPTPAPNGTALIAWGYLIVFGSLISFTSYITMIRVLPMQVAMTYAYVNPVIAVVLGSLILKEPVTGTMIGGMALVIAGVAGIFHERLRRRTN